MRPATSPHRLLGSPQAPAILFVDEFDAMGAARGGGGSGSGDESANIINELLVGAAPQTFANAI